MAKEFIRPSQFAHADMAALVQSEDIILNDEQLQELSSLYEGIFDTINPGKLVTGKVVRFDSDGVLVDINYKSDGLIPRYEFNESDLKKIQVGDTIEVILDELESQEGNVVLSFEKAKALKAWEQVTKLFEENKPVEGIVTHKVKGGLSVDVGIPAFLPGSQIDLQRVLDFDQYVGQTVVASILKLNKKRGNIIISRRKYLTEQRSEVRKQVLDTLSEGQVIQGQVKNITNYGAFVDLGGVDGLLHITDMTWGRIAHPSELLRVGQTVAVKVLSFDKNNEKISLGMKQLSDNPWQKVSESVKVGDKVKGKISSITDYGLFVEVQKGVEGLVHISEISWTDRINDLHSKFKVGQEIEAVVVSFDANNRRMSLSLKQMDKNPWDAVNEQFKAGQKIKGMISNITDFGIFVQLLPGIDGLVHISDLSWTEHINHPTDLYKKGDEVEAVVLNIDRDSKKISLGIKQLAQDPWENIEQEYKAGSLVEGEVSKITNFGAFIKLASGIEGLVHISELSDQNVEKVEDVLTVGQTAQFRVINVNKVDRKLGLSLKLQPSAKDEQRKEARSTARKETSSARTQASPRREKVAREVSTESKTKSALQLELEKHAARTKDESSSESEE